MAIDTRDKRSSAMFIGLPFRSLGLQPDAGVDMGERAAVAYLYSGLDYSGGGPPDPGTNAEWLITARRRGSR